MIKNYNQQNLNYIAQKALIDTYVSNDGFALINNVPKQFDDTKEKIQNSNDKQKLKPYIKQYYFIVCLTCTKLQKVKTPKMQRLKTEE